MHWHKLNHLGAHTIQFSASSIDQCCRQCQFINWRFIITIFRWDSTVYAGEWGWKWSWCRSERLASVRQWHSVWRRFRRQCSKRDLYRNGVRGSWHLDKRAKFGLSARIWDQNERCSLQKRLLGVLWICDLPVPWLRSFWGCVSGVSRRWTQSIHFLF